MPDVPSYDQLLAENAGLRVENAELRAENDELKRMFAVLTQRVVELERQLSADSSNSSRPPSSDAPWAKKPAEKRSSSIRSGRKPAKQQAAFSTSRRLVEDPDEVGRILHNAYQDSDIQAIRRRPDRQGSDWAAGTNCAPARRRLPRRGRQWCLERGHPRGCRESLAHRSTDHTPLAPRDSGGLDKFAAAVACG